MEKTYGRIRLAPLLGGNDRYREPILDEDALNCLTDAEVADENFISSLKENSGYLFTNYGRSKIMKWRVGLKSPDDDVFLKSQACLKAVGAALAYGGSRRVGNKAKIAGQWLTIKNALDGMGFNQLTEDERNVTLCEVFGIAGGTGALEGRDGEVMPDTHSEIADCIVAVVQGIAISTVKKYRDNRTEILKKAAKDRRT
ncbi:MAG: hypothetical protein ACD_55C00119G0006 [uncultured bacterium]|uniref:Uncharacterized protein n=1 Tax=Citrifermentans bemidjiense (strain ATCC BAA-1014 / DSM 16622 / JCM 12645 / Bem) TaxID=404380 RepID=B5EC34_CITBB|nr:hypothetical protein [Citrifermentans bemidjiense]ACH40490.1 hypothetical protein Gbem_3497 [Citrifermentans bemidjiense Bem]EKD59190.1 MAG: hypothetical protein ACD_55C00119G0006 [uncultured bacterium]